MVLVLTQSTEVRPQRQNWSVVSQVLHQVTELLLYSERQPLNSFEYLLAQSNLIHA